MVSENRQFHWLDSLEHAIMGLLESGKMEGAPPGDWLSMDFGDMDGDERMHYARTSNDGFEIWLGSPGIGWKAFYRAPDARRLAWFILWDWWIVSTWCGLRRRIWYYFLHRSVVRMQKANRNMAIIPDDKAIYLRKR